MEAGVHEQEHHHHHHHGEDAELNPATWRDGKRYAWLLGLIIPLAPFIAWAYVEVTGWGGFWYFGPILVFVVFPLLDILIGMDSSEPARTASSSGSNRTATTAGAPTSSSRSSTPG